MYTHTTTTTTIATTTTHATHDFYYYFALPDPYDAMKLIAFDAYNEQIVRLEGGYGGAPDATHDVISSFPPNMVMPDVPYYLQFSLSIPVHHRTLHSGNVAFVNNKIVFVGVDANKQWSENGNGGLEQIYMLDYNR